MVVDNSGCLWMVVDSLDGCGWLRMVVHGCGWLWMVLGGCILSSNSLSNIITVLIKSGRCNVLVLAFYK